MKKILIAIPTAKYIEPDTFKSIFELEIPAGYTLYFEYFYGYNIAQIRNLIVDHTINNGYDYLLSVDSDIVLPRDALVRMLSTGKDIVTGVYRQRRLEEVIPEIYVNKNSSVINISIDELNLSNELLEVEACGFGGVLINRDVLTTINYPHFVYQDAILMEHTTSEDVYFCQKAKEFGFKTFCITTLRYGHIGEFELHP